jgi:anti-sigma regulatory factor (Ser/Thr protein kinase)
MEPRLYSGYEGYPPLSSVFYSTTLSKSPASAAQARLFLDCVRSHVSAAVLEDARLLVSELVANAVEHVREEGDLELRVSLADGVLRVEVLDPGPGFTPPPRPPGADRGWGLHFTDRLASRWAVDRDEGARVWFELLSDG